MIMIGFSFLQNIIIGLHQANILSIFPINFESYKIMLQSGIAQTYGISQHLISLLTGIFSVLLLLLSISSYRKTGLKNILYAVGAFGLFAVRLFIDSFDEIHNILDDNELNLLNSIIILAILILFFLSIVKRNV